MITSSAEQQIDEAPEVVPTEPVTGYAARTASGGVLTTIVQYCSAAITFLVQIVLAWWLVPEQFGLVGMASAVVAVVGVLRDAGAGQILVHRQREFASLATPVFKLCLAASLICAVVTVAIAPLVAKAYGTHEVVPLLYWMALRLPISVFGLVSWTWLAINMRWKAISALNLSSQILSAFLAIMMARAGYGVYSLVIPPIIADAARGLGSWFAADFKANASATTGAFRSILANGAFASGTALTLALRGQGDYILLGILSNARQTGLYFFAFSISATLARLATNGFSFVLTPVLAKLDDDHKRRTAAITRALYAFAVIGMLPIILQAVLAWPVFRLFLQPKWHDAAILFFILSLLNLLKFMNTVPSQAMAAMGQFKTTFIYAIAFAPVELTMFLIGAKLGGALGVACFAAISALLDFVAWQFVSLRTLDIRLVPTLSPLWKPVLASVPIALLAIVLARILPQARWADVVRIIVVVAVGSIAYVGVLFVIWRPVVTDIIGLTQRVLFRPRLSI